MSVSFRHIRNHSFPDKIAAICCGLRSRTNMGLGTIRVAVETVFEVLGLDIKLPVRSTIDNWMRKNGLATYLDASTKLSDSKYFIIADESISIGSQKLLLILGVDAAHASKPLTHEDVEVLGLHIAPSWPASAVQQKVAEAQRKVGHDAEYTLSDAGHNIRRGLEDAGPLHHSDISHAMGVILKGAYDKDEQYNDFQKTLASKRLEFHLTDKAFLLPPNMRTICRFMNIDGWVDWSRKMLAKYDSLSPENQQAYAFLPPFSSLVEELHAINSCIKFIEKECKAHGFTRITGLFCVRTVLDRLVNKENATNKMKLVGAGICKYLSKEMGLLRNGERVCLSSDIIESMFGKYKASKSPDKLCGIRSSVLAIPMYGALSSTEKLCSFDFKGNMETVRMEDLKEWESLNLLDNWRVEREAILGHA